MAFLYLDFRHRLRTCDGTHPYRPSARDGSAESAAGANSPARNRGQAAAAIMAALSVEKARVGNATVTCRRAASAVKRARSSRFAATPPVTRIARGSEGFRGREGLLHQVAHHRVLETGDEVQRRLRAEGERIFAGLRRAPQRQHGSDARVGFLAHVVQLHVAQRPRS